MFQNITQNEEAQEYEDEQYNKKGYKLKNLFSIRDIVLYAISFMVSMVSFGDINIAPFGLAILAAVCSNKIPVGIVFIVVGIGTGIRFGIAGLLTYILIALLFTAMILIFRPKLQDETRNEKQKLGIYIAIAAFTIQTSKMFFTMFLLYDLLTSLMLGITTYIFYKIFANSIGLIREYGIKKVFTVEEIMGTSLLISIAICALSALKVFGLSISNIFSIMIVLFLGWENGMLIGATAGITIGMVLGIINDGGPILIASYAISGMIAGILNKLGKIGVIIGFCIGNALITYLANGNTIPVITIREILIASLGLLLIPKNVDIDISDIIGKTKLLPVTGSNKLDENKETIYKLNSVSETISEMAKSYNEVAATTLDIDEGTQGNDIKRIFEDELYNNIENLTDNLIYEDIVYADSKMIDSIYDALEKKDEILQEELINILEENNNYIVRVDNNIEEGIKEDIDKIVKAINHTYKIHKLNILWQQKEASNKRTLANQLRWSFKGYIFFG